MVAMLDFYHSFVKSDDIDQPITIPLAGKELVDRRTIPYHFVDPMGDQSRITVSLYVILS